MEFDTPTASDNLVLSWSFRIDEFGGVVDQSHGAWLGMSSTPLIVDDHVYVQADGCVVCIDINTGEVVNMVSGYTSTADFYHYLGYGGGYILDYVSHQVFDADLVPVCRMPADISYLKWYDGYFYGISSAGVFCKYLPTETDGNDVMRNLAPETERMNPQFGLYGITSSGIMVGDDMYYVSVSGSSITVNAVALGGKDFGKASSWPIDQIASRYLDDGWLTYYDGYLYLTSYTKGLFGDTSSSGNAGISYFAVDGLVFDKDSYGFVDLGSGYTTLTSAFVIYNGHGYVLTSRDSSQAKLVSFNIGENGEPVKDDEVPSAATHGGIVISVGDLTDDGGCVRVYLLAYSGSRPYVFEDVHTVVDGKDVWTLGKYNIKLTDQNYGSQGVRFGQNGQIVYFNDSGAVYCYVAPRGNAYAFEFVSDKGDSETFTAYGSTPAEALASLGTDIVSLNVLKKIDTVFEKPADGSKLFVWKHNLADYSWVEIDGLRSSEYNTDHIYRITYTLPAVYTVVFESDGSTVSSTEMDEGTLIILPGAPVKVGDAQYSYVFKGWDGYTAGMSVTSDVTFSAVFEQVLNEYTVTFVNGDTELQSSEVAYGQVPVYSGAAPVKDADAKYTYTFRGWEPEISAVSGDATYTAVFDRHPVVTLTGATFDLASGMLSATGTASADVVHLAAFLGDEKVGDEAFAAPVDGSFSVSIRMVGLAPGTYTLKAWDASVYSVSSVEFTVAEPVYVLTFPDCVTVSDGDGPVTSGDSFAAGTVLTVAVESRTGYTYELSIVLVNGAFTMPSEDVTLTVTYTAELYTVTFVNGDAELQSTEVAYGETPVYSGDIPVKDADSKYTYVFKGWEPEVAAVTGDATYAAFFEQVLNRYTVTFVNGDTELQSTEVAYGETPVYSGDVPVKDADSKYTYVFKGWEPEVATVTGDATYAAVFTAVPAGSGGSGTSTPSVSVTSVTYDVEKSRLDLAGASTLAVVHFRVFQGDEAVGSEGFATVTDGLYSTFMRVEGLTAGVYTIRVWGSSADALATMAFRVGESSGTETVVPSGAGDEVTVTPAEMETSIDVLPENGVLKIDTSESTGVTVSKTDVERLNDKDASLEVELSDGSVLLDKGVLSNIAGKDGSDVKLSLKATDSSSAKDDVKALIGDSPVYDVTLSVGGATVSALGGTATVTVAYTLDAGRDPSRLAVWCVSGDSVEVFACIYDGSGSVTFTTPHLSSYAVVYDLQVPGSDPVPGPTPGPTPGPQPVPGDTTGGDGGVLVYALVGAVVAALAVVGFLLVRRRA